MERSRIIIPNSFNPDPFYFVFSRARNKYFILNDKIDYYSIAVLLDGGVEYELNGEYYHLTAGDILVCPPGTARKAKTDGFKISDIDFYGDRIEGFDEPIVIRQAGFKKINMYMERINFQCLSEDVNYKAAVRGYILIMLNELLSHLSGDIGMHVVKMKKYIIEHYMQNITMEDLSKFTHLTSAYCGVLFKKDMGCTVTEYINKLRIDTAIRYINEDNTITLDEIALNVGYCDVYQFGKMFKRIVGESPGEYRKNHYKMM